MVLGFRSEVRRFRVLACQGSVLRFEVLRFRRGGPDVERESAGQLDAQPLVDQEERAAGRETPAAARHVKRFELGPPRAHRSRELERRRTLPGDHVRVIERRHERRAAIRSELDRYRLAVSKKTP